MKNICLNWTISVLTALFSLFLITTVGFIFHISINPFYPVFALLVFMILLAKLTIKDKKKNAIKSILAQYVFLFDFLILFGVFCYLIPDYSYDGTTYHQAMIILLKWGLNPVWDNVVQFANSQEYNFKASVNMVETFLKFFEIIGANIYIVFEKIELTKITNFILMLCAFCYSVYTLKNYNFSNLKCCFFSFLLIYNPVCIYQMFTNYVDGAFYFVFLILLFACINYTKDIDKNKSLYLICISSVILSNLKLTGLFTCVVISLIFLFIYRSKHLLASFIIALMLIFISGINPYYTNLKQGRNIFYPVIQNSILNANREGMITSYPQGFENKNRFEKLFFSLFAESQNLSPLIESEKTPKLKFPFTIKGDGTFIFSDMRLGGFGYFFSGILLCSLFLSIFIRFKNKEDKKLFWVVIAILLLTILGNHEAWWARFVPQTWMIPLWILIFLNLNEQNTKQTAVICSYLIAVICLLNSVIINVQNFLHSKEVATEFYKLIKSKPEAMYFYKKDMDTNHENETFLIKMREYGIKTIYIDE